MSFGKVYLACLWKKIVEELSDFNEKSYKSFIKRFGVPVESVNGGRQVKPYVDCDPVMPFDYTDEDWEADILKTKLLILTCFAEITLADIRCIKRKYQVKDEKKDGVKCSVHYIVDKIRMSAGNMLDMFKKLGIQGFDKDVYNENRFLTSIFTNKKIVNGENKSLPMFMPDGDDDIKHYLVSYVEEDFVDYDLKFPKIIKKENKVEQNNNILQQINKGYEDQDLVKKLVECLSVKRADDYGDWLNVGFCLYCISPECLDLWVEFSKKSDKYEEGVCEKHWGKMSKKGMSIGTLKYWAKQDDAKKYKKVIEESLDKYVEVVLGSDGSHYDIAVITSKIMADKMVYDGKMKSWFFVDEKTNIWKSDKEGVKMVQILSVNVCEVFLKASNNYGKKSLECEQQFKVSYEEKSKKCISIAKCLKNASFQDSVKKCCKSTSQKDDFFEKFMDKNEGLFACDNLIIDLDKKMFRPIEPTDYIMTTTGYDYDENVEQVIIDEIMDILKTILPVWSVLCYLLDTLSSRLYGKNLLQLFFIWTGKGANGKSVIGNLLDITFGKYFGKIGADTITKPTKNANSTSEFSRISQSRIVLTEEPDEGDKLQVSILKEHSGDSKIRTRGLFQESYEYIPQYALIINCNEIPELSKVDGNNAIKRRLRVIHFPTKFCENPSNPNEKLMNPLLNIKLDNDTRYRQAFLKILVDIWFSKDLKSKIDTPQSICDSSKAYMDNCNCVKAFLEEKYENVEYTPLNNAKIKSSVLYTDFKIYCMENKIVNKINDKTFKPLVEAEGYTWEKRKDGNYYMNIIKKEEVEDE
jgi:P4 family phage/plasmid primase-like protien